MKVFADISLKKRLVLAFAGVVVLAALLSSVVFTVVLVSNMKRSAREKIEETSKVAFTHVEDVVNGLKIYADLISSDMTFGQALSYDSSFGISQKIGEFAQLSRADFVAFIPRPEQYVAIRNEVFVNAGNEGLVESLRKQRSIQKLLGVTDAQVSKGWIGLGDEIFLFAMKPVLHFGANMGVILLGRRSSDALAGDISSATGAQITIFDKKQIHGTTLKESDRAVTALPSQAAFAALREAKLREDYRVGSGSYFSFFAPIKDVEGKSLATLALSVSNATILQARNQTLRRVLLVAVLATVLSGIIGYFLARAISTPLLRITDGIHTIMEKGDLGIRVPETTGAEIGVLSSSFNRLLGQLQEAHEKLASSERRMKEELTTASTVQEMLFPERVTRLGRLELSSFIDASTETGGDWFGYSEDPVGKKVSVLIGDVTGHGMPAALITAIANGFFRGLRESTYLSSRVMADLQSKLATGMDRNDLSHILGQLESKELGTAEMLTILNDILLESTKGRLLMTFLASVFDPARSEIRYANAGHNRPFFCQRQTDGVFKVGSLPSDPSPRLGESAGVQYAEQRVVLREGDLIIWYTDGLLECENPAGEMYGKSRLVNLLRKVGGRTTEEIRDSIVRDAYKFFAERPRKDDVTLVVGRVLS